MARTEEFKIQTATEMIPVHREISERVEKVLQLIIDNPTISQTQIADQLGISIKQAKNATELLKQNNRIHREGSARNGKWIID